MKSNNKALYVFMAAIAILGITGIKLHSQHPAVVQANDITLANLNAIMEEESDPEKDNTDPEKGDSDPEKGETDPEKGETDSEKGSVLHCTRVKSSKQCRFTSGPKKGQFCSMSILSVEEYTVNSFAIICRHDRVTECAYGCK